jgi:hypothetical protein
MLYLPAIILPMVVGNYYTDKRTGRVERSASSAGSARR